MRKGLSVCDESSKTSCVNKLSELNLLDWRVDTPEASTVDKVDYKWCQSRLNNLECDSSEPATFISSNASQFRKPKEIANLFNPGQSRRLSSCNLKASKTCRSCTHVSEHNNFNSVKTPSSSSKPMGDYYTDCKWAHKDAKSLRGRDNNLVDGELSEEMSSSSRISNPFFLNQKRSLSRKSTRFLKSRKRSTMSVIREGKYECGDYFGCPPTMDNVDGGHKQYRVAFTNKAARDSKSGHYALHSSLNHPRPTAEGRRDEIGPTLENMGIGKGDLNIKGVCAPPKRNICEALYQRVATFQNPDVSVIIDSYEFLCHKIVLQCYSEYFEDLKDHSAVEVEGMTKGAFIAIYNWMLAPGFEGLRYIQKNNILEVLIASKILVIKELENQCLAFIDSKEAFSEENAFLLFIDASRRKQMEIMELMVPRIRVFFLVLVCSVEFTELEVEDLCTLLQSNYIIVHCEMEVFMAAVKWLMVKWEERSKVLGTVMKCIRFGLMTPAQLVDIRKNPMSPEFIGITSDKSVQIMIEDGLAYSVECGLTGRTDQHTQRCELLKLKIPEPRNWAKNNKEYKSYGEFLSYLDEVSKNPQLYYDEMKGDLTKNDSPYANGTFVESSSSDESDDTKIDRGHVKCINPGTKKPSLSDLLCKEKTRQVANYIPSKSEVHDKKRGRSLRVHDDKTSTESWTRAEKSSGHRSSHKESAVSAVGDLPPKKLKKRTTLREGAAIIIQATYRGYSVRKRLLKTRENAAKEIQSAKRQTFDNMFLRMKNYLSDKEVSSEDDRSVHGRGRGNVKSNSQLKRSSSTESNESIVSVKESPGCRKSMAYSRNKSILIVGGVNPSSKHPSAHEACLIYRYSLEKNAWEKLDRLPSPRYYHGSALLKGRLYIVGGCSPESDSNNTPSLCTENFSYDLANRVWNKEPELKTPRRSFGFVVLGNHLYAIGGQDINDTILSSVERFDPSRRSWEEVASLPEPTIGAAICVYKNHIWVAGGMSGSTANFHVSKEVWSYDPRQDSWTKRGQLRFGRAFASLNVYDDYLFLVGGATSENGGIVSNDHIDVWDGEMWKLKGNIDLPRHGHSVVFLGSLMLLLGGVTTKTVKGLTQVDSLCMMSGSRSKQISALPSPLVGHSCLLLPPING